MAIAGGQAGVPAAIIAGLYDDDPPKILKGPVYILGHKYNFPEEEAAAMEDIESKIWCTYRKNFKCISDASLTSDKGWGCTLRCGQMMLAQALVCHHLGRDFRWPPKIDDSVYKMILSKFLDVRDAEYSIQKIAQQGQVLGKPVGHWVGPNEVAHAIKKLSMYDGRSRLAVHVCMDALVIVDDLKAVATVPHCYGQYVPNEREEDIPQISKFRPLLFFIPLHLGQNHLNEKYKEPLKDCLTLSQSVGFIGGKPKRTFYFIGYNDNDLVYLDPHTSQPVVQARPDGSIPDDTYHTSSYGSMNINKLDPSVVLGFFCKDEEDLDNLMEVVHNDSRLKLFDVTEHRPYDPYNYRTFDEGFEVID